jgi:hypothetical protein
MRSKKSGARLKTRSGFKMIMKELGDKFPYRRASKQYKEKTNRDLAR